MSTFRKHQLAYIITDLISAEIVWFSFLLFRWLVYEGKVFGLQSVVIPAFDFVQPLIIYPIACVVIYYLSGYYLRPLHKKYLQELSTTFTSSVIIALGA